MKIHSSIACFVLVSLFFVSSLIVQSADAAPRTSSLVIPVALDAKSAKSGDTLQCVVTTGPKIPITAIALSADGKRLAAGGYKEVLVWDLAGAKLLKRIGTGQISDFVHALVFVKDARLLAVGEGTPGGSGAVRIFDIDTGRQTLIFEEPKDVVYALAISPDGKLLAAGGADNLVHIWNLSDNKITGTIKEHSDWVLSASFSADGKFLATGSADKSMLVWEVGSWKSVVRMKQLDTVRGSVFSSDGNYLAVAVGGAVDKAVRIRRKSDSRQTRSLYTGAAMPLDVIWHPKPNRIYVSCDDKTVKQFDGTNARLLRTFTGHTDWVYTIALSSDGTRLASGSADGTVKLWNTTDGKLIATVVHLTTGKDDWLIVTEQGYLAASSPNALTWKGKNLSGTPDELTKKYSNSELVQEALTGKKVQAPAQKKPAPQQKKPALKSQPKKETTTTKKPQPQPKKPAQQSTKPKPQPKKQPVEPKKPAAEPKKEPASPKEPAPEQKNKPAQPKEPVPEQKKEAEQPKKSEPQKNNTGQK